MLRDYQRLLRESVKLQIDQSRADFTKFEDAMKEQLGGSRNKTFEK